VRRFVHCSTVGVYGPLESLPADETTPPMPDIAYERSKLEGEAAIRSVAEEAGLEAVILRPTWVYGPLCPRTQKLIRTVARKRFFFRGDGSNRRHPDLHHRHAARPFNWPRRSPCRVAKSSSSPGRIRFP
jgi:dihydroflavonol-4-reductase